MNKCLRGGSFGRDDSGTPCLFLVWSRFVWFGFGLVGFDLVWFGLVWFDLVWFGLGCFWFDLVWFGLFSIGLVFVWFGLGSVFGLVSICCASFRSSFFSFLVTGSFLPFLYDTLFICFFRPTFFFSRPQAMQSLSPLEFEGVLHPVFEEDEMKLIIVGGTLGAAVGVFQLLVLFR